MLRNRKVVAAQIVQKFCRGYRVHRRQYWFVKQGKLEKNLAFFKVMRHNLRIESQKTIRRVYFKYRVNKIRNEERRQEEERKRLELEMKEKQGIIKDLKLMLMRRVGSRGDIIKELLKDPKYD